MKTLEAERLILREWQESDAADLYRIFKESKCKNLCDSVRYSMTKKEWGNLFNL